jgi:hypothetical protein
MAEDVVDSSYSPLLAKMLRVGEKDIPGLSLAALGRAAMGANTDEYDIAKKNVDDARVAMTEALSARRTGLDPGMLALAQGFLAPTRTGSFGESLGTAAGNYATAQVADEQRVRDLAKMRYELARQGLGDEQAAATMGLNVASKLTPKLTAVQQQVQSEGIDPTSPAGIARVREITSLTAATEDMKTFAASSGISPADPRFNTAYQTYRQQEPLRKIASVLGVDLNTPVGIQTAQKALQKEEFRKNSPELAKVLDAMRGDFTNPDDLAKAAAYLDKINALETSSKEAQIKASQASTAASEATTAMAPLERQAKELLIAKAQAEVDLLPVDAETKRLLLKKAEAEVAALPTDQAIKAAQLAEAQGRVAMLPQDQALKAAQVQKAQGEVSQLADDAALKAAQVKKAQGEVAQIADDAALKKAQVLKAQEEAKNAPLDRQIKQQQLLRGGLEVKEIQARINEGTRIGDPTPLLAAAKGQGVPVGDVSRFAGMKPAEIVAQRVKEREAAEKYLLEKVQPLVNTVADDIVDLKRALELSKKISSGVTYGLPLIGGAAKVLSGDRALINEFDSLAALSAKQNRIPGDSNVSNLDVKMMQLGTFSSDKEPITNKTIIEFKLAQRERDRDYYNYLNRYSAVNGNIGAEAQTYWRKYLEANPITTRDPKGAIIINPKRMTFEQYFAAPRVQVDANGKEVKP